MARNILGGAPTFDGQGNVEEFINLFGYESVMFKWDKAAQASAIKFCLSKKALRYYNELDASKKGDIDEIFKKLRQCCAKAPEYYLNKLYTRTLKADEPISSYCHDIQNLLEKAMPELNPETKGMMLRARLISVVPESVKNFLEMLSDKTWSELVAIFDKSTDYKAIIQSSSVPTEVEINKSETYKTPSPDRRVFYDQRDKPRNGEPASGRRFDVEYFFCKRRGHKQSDCWKKTEAMRAK